MRGRNRTAFFGLPQTPMEMPSRSAPARARTAPRLAVEALAALLLAAAGAGELGAQIRTPPTAHAPSASLVIGTGTRDFQVRESRIRISWERVGMPAEGESPMGLFGLGYSLRGDSRFRIGIAGYGAATGERGGFFTGGGHAGGVLPLGDRAALEAGLFLGAGGGGAAPQGGGLMVRPHAGVRLGPLASSLPLRLGAALAHVHFPNGEIASTHVALSAELPRLTLARPGPAGDIRPSVSPDLHGLTPRSFRFTGTGYRTSSGSTDRDGEPLAPTITILGFEYREWLGSRSFVVLETGGAAFGGTDGFAEITVGGGGSWPLGAGDRIRLVAQGGIGGAGGGRVATGGGLLLRGRVGVEADVPGSFLLGAGVGLVDAPTGAFTAASADVRIGLTGLALRPAGVAAGELEEERPVDAAGWRIRASHQSYLDHRRTSGRTDLEEHRIDHLALKFDRLLEWGLFLTGQAIGAYRGEAGGYAVGLVGVGATTPDRRRVRLTAEATAGVAGGARVDVGEGFVLQPMAGMSVDLDSAFAVQILAGGLLAPTSGTRAPVVDFGVSHTFSTPRLR